MSLDWDVTGCRDPEEATDMEWMAVDFFVWASIAVDIGTITTKNAPNWFARLKLLADQNKWKLPWDDDETLMAMIGRWVGLRVNVATLSDKDWLEKLADQDSRTLRIQRAKYTERETV